jgi:hypothetical protein
MGKTDGGSPFTFDCQPATAMWGIVAPLDKHPRWAAGARRAGLGRGRGCIGSTGFASDLAAVTHPRRSAHDRAPLGTCPQAATRTQPVVTTTPCGRTAPLTWQQRRRQRGRRVPRCRGPSAALAGQLQNSSASAAGESHFRCDPVVATPRPSSLGRSPRALARRPLPRRAPVQCAALLFRAPSHRCRRFAPPRAPAAVQVPHPFAPAAGCRCPAPLPRHTPSLHHRRGSRAPGALPPCPSPLPRAPEQSARRYVTGCCSSRQCHAAMRRLPRSDRRRARP